MKLCGVPKRTNTDAYLKSELIEMVFEKMENGKFKNLSKSDVRKMKLSELCELLKLKVTSKSSKPSKPSKSKRKEEQKQDRVCTPRKVKEYPNAYSKKELQELALSKLRLPITTTKKMRIEELCKELNIDYINVPVKNPKKKQKIEPEPPSSISTLSSAEEEDEEEEEEDEKCIRKSKLKLLDHQRKVVKFVNRKKTRGLLVVHSVGSGKTLTAVTVSQCFLEKYPKSKVIVVTPTSLQKNFKKELQAYGVKNTDNYEFYTIQSFTMASKKGKINCNNKLLILDEAHNVRTYVRESIVKDKKDPTKTIKKQVGINAAELMKCTANCKKVLLLTATPMVNSPHDLLNLIAMIEGDINPIKKGAFNRLSPESLIDYLKCKVSVFNPGKNEYDKYYPRKEEEELFIRMTPEYQKKYLEVKDETIGSEDRINLFGGTQGLVYFYNGVRRATNNLEERNSPKVNRIMKVIQENPDSKFLIFSHFIEAGNKLLSKRLDDKNIPYLHIDGSMSKKQRDDVVKKYNSGESKILIISKAGGEGLDLKNTNFVFIMEPAWNESTIQQVIGRAVRYKSHHSLPKKDRVVKIYKLYMIQPHEAEHIDEICDKYLRKSPDEDVLSVDLYMRNLSAIKQQRIDKFLQKLAKISIENIDCDKPIKYNDPNFKEFYEKMDIEDLDIEDEDEDKPKKSKRKSKQKDEELVPPSSKKQKKAISELEEDILPESSEELVPPSSKKQKKAISELEEDILPESSEELVPPSSKKQKKPISELEEDILPESSEELVPPSSKKQKKPVSELEEDILPESSEELVPPSSKKQKKPISGDEDILLESSELVPPSSKKQKKPISDDEDILLESSELVPPSSKKQKKPISYDEEELVPPSPKKKKKSKKAISDDEEELVPPSPKKKKKSKKAISDDEEELVPPSPKKKKKSKKAISDDEEELVPPSSKKKQKKHISDAYEYVKSEVEPKYKVGKFLGEGMSSIVFEGYDKNGNKVAVKYFKNKGDTSREYIILNKLGELYGEFGKNNNIWIIKYCGDSLQELIDKGFYTKKDIPSIFKMGLEAIYRFHKKTGNVHCDIKPDNICVKDDRKSFELMDYGNANSIPKYNNDASIFLKSKYKGKYSGKSFYELFKEKVPLDYFLPSVHGNFVWSLRSSFQKKSFGMTTADDIEAYILSLWNIFDKDYKLRLIYSKNKNQTERKSVNDEILEFRLNPANCPYPILRDALTEIRKDYSISVQELCKNLNLKCKL
jgi:superfamily II DNA or RNA helicase